MIVISDTTPINYLVLIGQIDLLPRLFGRVLVPPAVLDELQSHGSPEALQAWSIAIPTWLEVRTPSYIDATIRLGRGEVEAISLARELRANEVLIDDLKARKAAMVRGLKVTGTLLVLDRAARAGWVDLPSILQQLMTTNFRAPAALVRHLLAEDARRKQQSKQHPT
ncbi:MAG TPA: DUF3368 domain-containing protein [Phycisphaerae bacterium]|nr:DUF3368 domain-containing protein [Phycisphaerae bacterium]HSA29934.1 DUF3368 domain-containing protein [Phycisphaerae bacterium]